MQSPCSETRYMVGCWSLTRPAMLFIGRADGSMEVWDLLEKSHEPSEVQNITIHSITCIKPFSCELRRRAACYSASRYPLWGLMDQGLHQCGCKNT